MSWGYVAVGAATVVGGYLSSQSQKSSAETAAGAQQEASEASIAEQRRQFDAIQQLLKPYTEGGEEALQAQRALLGLAGNEQQQTAIQQIQQSPQYTSSVQAGENAILQNASATGGLRGGNVQSSLAQFRPQLLSQLIQQQYSNLGGLTSLGENAAALTGNAGLATGANISGSLNDIGAARAGSALASGQANANYINQLSSLAGLYAGSQSGTGAKF